jgi:molybdenum cofactor cytidylyltransferase
MQLIKALRYIDPSCLAFVGAGGKTTAIFRVAGELLTAINEKQAFKTVLVTTTTHFGTWQTEHADHFCKVNSLTDIADLEKDLPNGIVLLTGDEKNNRLSGLQTRILERLRDLAQDNHLPLLIEADGSHTCPLKAPAEHEPAIPNFTQEVVVVAGLQGLGKPLSKKWVNRPEKFAELSELHIGEIVTSNSLAKVLLNRNGGLKNIPSNARRIALLNQADTPELQSAARSISGKLIPGYHSVIIASLSGENSGLASDGAQYLQQGDGIHAVVEQIGGIILAAGGSSRFGEPKQLLRWRGEPLIRHVADTALKAGLSPVSVVVGSSAEEVKSALIDLQVRIVNNSEWETGLSSSIKAGITSLPKVIGGVVFMQADQPHIPPALIERLVEAHEVMLSPIIAPQINGQRGNPVLFDLSIFPDLLSLEGDIGGRALFERFPVQWVPWHDQNILMDIDSPDDYRKFLGIYPEDEEKK